MAKFIKLTGIDGLPVYVNVDTFHSFYVIEGQTRICVYHGSLGVIETPDEILALIEEAE